MNLSVLTLLSIPIILLVIFIIDAYIIIKKGSSESISAYIIRHSYKVPFFPFITGLLIGILVGHLFWQMPTLEIPGVTK